MNTLLKLAISIVFMLFGHAVNAQSPDGSYKGTLETQGIELDLIYNFTTVDGALTATLDVPLQGATGITLDKVTFIENKISITSAAMKMSYLGTFTGTTIKGTYTQMGKDYPLDLEKIEKTLPGNTALPSTPEELAALANLETGNYTYAVEDYFKTPEAYGFKLSPDGVYISYMKRRETGERDVYLKNTETQKETLLIKQEEDLIRVHFWASNDRILYVQDKGGDENYHVFGVDVDGGNKQELTPFDGVKVGILAVLKEDPDHIIIQMNKDNAQLEEPYKLNINTGELTKLYSITEGEPAVAAYEFDKYGNLRGMTRIVNGIEQEVLYKIDGEFKTLMVVPFGEAWSIVNFNYASSNPDEAYVASNLTSDKLEIQRYDLRANKVLETVFKTDTYDAGGITLSRKRNYEIDYFSYTGEKTNVIPVSDTFKKLQRRLKKEFGDREFYAVGRTDNENKYMISVTSDRIVGEYYVYDVEKDTVTLLYKLLPQLKEKDMATMKPISFQSRDGLTIHGYITIPAGTKKGEKLPVIVNPHGGPQGLRDTWGFNPSAQLFASRGYATLHVNFRISGGYGKAFLNAGYGQIGRKAMDDVEDGLDYVIAKGWVDKDRVAIYGASHGGYAVLRGMTKTPDKYACGVDYVGVSNINTFMSTFPAYWEKYRALAEKIWYDPNDPAQQKIIDEVSPALHVDKIKKPLFVVQGANDPRVNIDEADQIVEQLRARDVDVPYMVKYDEGHGFGKEENRLELYKAMMGFYAKHLKSERIVVKG